MVTNGSLFTTGLIRETKEEWNLTKVQIPLDGDLNEYCRRKNYIDNDPAVFDRVIASINLLLTEGISLMIRLNTDFDNADQLFKFAEKLSELVKYRKI